MEVLRSDKPKLIWPNLIIALGFGAVVWVIVVVGTASGLSHGNGIAVGKIGPIKMFELSRLPMPGGGYQAAMRLISFGLAQYVLLLVGLGLLSAKLQKRF